jgi:molecular chaperone GrpE
MSTDETLFEQERSLRPEEYQAALDSARRENAELQDKYLRAVAASENTRKQADRVATARASQQLQRVYTRLLEVADNLERALSYAAENDPLAPGVRATLRQLLDLLLREGVTPINVAPGMPFDPRFHEAIATHAGDVPEMTVAEVKQPGYMFDGQVLRPARVVVAQPAHPNA